MFHFTLFLLFSLYKKLELTSLNKKLNVFRIAAPLPHVRRLSYRRMFLVSIF